MNREQEDTPAGAAIGPLSGIKLLDLTAYLAGPYGCALLGDMGAEVIKVEPPAGDTMRNHPSTLQGDSRAFIGTNRNKRAIVIDLKTPEGLSTLRRLVAEADVFVHNFRPSVPPRLGIDYESLRAINDRLVYCAITGFGDTGPFANNPGFDQILQCMTGLCTFQGGPDAMPEIVLGSVVDYYTSALVAYGITAALLQRERDGKGQYVGASLLRSALAMQSGRFVWPEGEARETNRDVRLAPLTGIHPTREGFLYISTHSTHFWRALCELVGMPDFAGDPRFQTMSDRLAHADVIVPRLRECLSRHSAGEWAARFGEKVPNAPVRPIEDMFDHPQVRDQDLVATLDHAMHGRYRGFTKAIQLARTPGPAPIAAPILGEHTVEILRRHGFAEDEIADLLARRAVRQAEETAPATGIP